MGAGIVLHFTNGVVANSGGQLPPSMQTSSLNLTTKWIVPPMILSVILCLHNKSGSSQDLFTGSKI